MNFWNHTKLNLKKYFFFGIATFIPAYITIILVIKIIGFFDDIILKFAILFPIPDFLSFLKWPGVGAVLSVIFLVILGFISRQYLGNRLLLLVDKLFAIFPISKQIYRALKKMTDTLLEKDNKKFSRVVLVPFPHKDVHAIGFLNGRAPEIMEGKDHYYVYVPTAINPTSGFLISVSGDQIIHSDMKVDEAFALILSGGMANTKN